MNKCSDFIGITVLLEQRVRGCCPWFGECLSEYFANMEVQCIANVKDANSHYYKVILMMQYYVLQVVSWTWTVMYDLFLLFGCTVCSLSDGYFLHATARFAVAGGMVTD